MYLFFLSLISFLFFRMEVHLYIMLHQKEVKNVLNYWFKMVQVFIFKTRCDFLFVFWKLIINLICFIYFYFSFYFLSPIFFLLFRMDGHLFILLDQKDMKNVLKYWFKMVQMLMFKPRCDFLFVLFVFWKN